MTTKPMRRHWRDELDIWSAPVLANMLSVLLSMLVITIPLAIIGLFGFMFRWVDDRNTQVFRLFFGTIRKVWWKAYVLTAIDLVIGGFIYFNLLMFQVMDMGNVFAFTSRSVTVLVAALFIVVNIQAWALISIWDAPLKQILKFSIQIVFVEPLWTFGIAIAFVFTLLASTILPTAVFVVATGAVAVYMVCRVTYHLIRKYFDDEDFKEIDFS